MAWAWRQPIDVHSKIILLALADHADDRGVCWPGVQGLVKKCSVSRRTIQRQIRMMQGLGLLDVKPRFAGSGEHTSNSFTLNLDVQLAADCPLQASLQLAVDGGGVTVAPGGGVTVAP